MVLKKVFFLGNNQMKHKAEYPQSTSIQSSDYDDESKEMHITFVNGGKHKFSDVDKEVHDGLMKAQSPGSYFHSNIRRKHSSVKVD